MSPLFVVARPALAHGLRLELARVAATPSAVSPSGDGPLRPASPSIELPAAKRGRKSATAQAEHDAALAKFYAAILKMKSRLELPRREVRRIFAESLEEARQ